MLQTAHKDKKMADRSAHATIKRYFYQFDKTILELLEATSPDFSIVVEGIEDIDLTDGSAESLIQCQSGHLSAPYTLPSIQHSRILLARPLIPSIVVFGLEMLAFWPLLKLARFSRQFRLN